MRTTIKKLFTLLIVITLAACSDGDPGPKGDVGTTGPAGAAGAKGDKGDPGTANVIYSEWMEIEWNGNDFPEYKSMNRREPLITDEFFDKGGVTLFFIRVTQGDVTLVVPLPYALGNNSNMYGAAQLQAGEGYIGLVAQSTDGSDLGETVGEGLEVRYVLIPGGTLTTGGRVDYSYEALKKLYNIAD